MVKRIIALHWMDGLMSAIHFLLAERADEWMHSAFCWLLGSEVDGPQIRI